MANVATLTARLEADIRDFDRDMKTANRQVDKFERNVAGASRGMGTFQKILGGIGATIAIQKLAVLGKEMTMLAVDAEEAGSAFRTTFGPAVDRAQKFVSQFANQAGFAEHELQQLMATTGNIVQGLGATEEVSADLSESMARLAGDVASFSNAAGGAPAVLHALQSALTGEREALKTYGIVVSETEVVERALRDTHKSSAAELSKLDKAMATMAIATERAGKAVGDLDRTQDSAANTLRRFQAEVKEAKTRIGSQLVPVLSDLLEIAEDLIPAFEGIARTFVSGLKDLKPYLAALGGLAKLMGKVSDDTGGAEKELNWYQQTMRVVGGAITDSVMAPMRSLGDLLGFVTGATEEATAAIEGSAAVQQDAALKTRALAIAQEAVVDAQNDSIRSTDSVIDRFRGLRDTANDAAWAIRNVASALREQADPVFAALQAYKRWQTTIKNIDEDAKRTDEELMDLALAVSDVGIAFDALDGTNVEAAVSLFATSLGIGVEKAEELLYRLGLLDGKTFTSRFELQTLLGLPGFVPEGDAGGRATRDPFLDQNRGVPVPRKLPEFASGGMVPGPVGAPQLAVVHGGETVTPVGAGGITVNMQITDDFRDPAAARRIIRDLARELEDYQRETIR